MKNFLLIFIHILCFSCTVQPKVVDAEVSAGPLIPNESMNRDTIQLNVDKEITFEEYLNQIPVLPVGYSKSCTGDLEIIDLDNSFYTPESARVMGRMKSIQNTHFIICAYPADVELPFLEVFTSTGENILGLPLIEIGICGDIDPLNDGTSEFTIISETAIALKDIRRINSYNSTVKADTIRLEELIDY